MNDVFVVVIEKLCIRLYTELHVFSIDIGKIHFLSKTEDTDYTVP